MTIRYADRADIDRLAAIWHEGWHEAHAAILPAELSGMRTRDSFRQRLVEALADVRVVGATGDPDGFAMIRNDELYQLYVAARARGTGAAAALIDDVETRLTERGVHVAWLACAVATCGRRGFTRSAAGAGWGRWSTRRRRCGVRFR